MMHYYTKKWRIIFAAALVFIIVCAAGCGSKEAAPAVESSSEDMTEAAQTAETAVAVEKPRLAPETTTVGICFAKSESKDNERLLFELKKSLEMQGFLPENIIVKERTESRSRQAAQVDECLEQGCKLMIVAAVSDKRIPSLTDQITAGGASAVFVNCTPESGELDRWEAANIPAVWIGATDEKKADSQMTILHDYSGTERGLDFNNDGQVGTIVVSESVDTMEKLEETIEDIGSKLWIIREVDSEEPEEVSQSVQDILNEYKKNVELILCPSESIAKAAAEGVQLRHRLVGRDILVIGTDAHEDTCTSIINKLISGSTFTDFYEQANLTAVAGKDLIEGIQRVKKIDSVVFKVTEDNAQEVLDQLWDTKEKVELAEIEEEAAAAAAASAEAAEAATAETVAEAATEETAAEATTEESAAEAGTEETAAEATTDESAAEAATEEAAAEATTEESSAESKTDDAAEARTEESAAEATTEEIAAEATTEESSAESKTDDAAEARTEETAAEATTEESSAESKTEDAAEARTEESASESKTDDAAEARTEESASESKTDDAAEARTEESASEATTEETAAAATTEESAAESKTDDASEARTEESAAESKTDDAAEARTEESAAESRTDDAAEAITEESAAESKTDAAAEATTEESAAEAATETASKEATKEEAAEADSKEGATTEEASMEDSASEGTTEEAAAESSSKDQKEDAKDDKDNKNLSKRDRQRKFLKWLKERFGR